MWTWNETNNEYWNKGTFENREKAIADAKDSGLTDFYIGNAKLSLYELMQTQTG